MKKTKVRVRVPIPEKPKLVRRLKWLAKETNRTFEEAVKFYIRGMEKEIDEQKLEIEKSKKRIMHYKECIRLGRELLEEASTQ